MRMEICLRQVPGPSPWSADGLGELFSDDPNRLPELAKALRRSIDGNAYIFDSFLRVAVSLVSW